MEWCGREREPAGLGVFLFTQIPIIYKIILYLIIEEDIKPMMK